jgi:hypothetical protein
MPVPALQKTWRFNINRTQRGNLNLPWHQEMMLKIKAALIGDGLWDTVPTGIWTVHSSSNGSVADTSDNWNTAADIVSDQEGDAHSWIVFNTGINGGVAQFMINMNNNEDSNANAQIEQITCFFSWTGGFSGGTTLVRPTASDESLNIAMAGGDQEGGPWAGQVTGNPRGTAWHMLMSDDGQEMRLFLYRDTQNYAFWGLGTLNDSPFTENWWGAVWSQANQQLQVLGTTVQGMWLHRGIPATPHAMVEDGSCSPTYIGYAADQVDANPFNAQSVGGFGDEVRAEAVFGEISLWATGDSITGAFATAAQVGRRGPKGRIKDLWITTNATQIGALFPADGSRAYHQYGANVTGPWDGATTPNNLY